MGLLSASERSNYPRTLRSNAPPHGRIVGRAVNSADARRRRSMLAIGHNKESTRMLVGVPAEVKSHEYRVAITPAGVHEFTRHGHSVMVESGAGVGSSITDREFSAAGATIVSDADDVWAKAELVLKVKEPIAVEYDRMQEGQTLFTYLHLAANKDCTRALLNAHVTGIAYETVQLPNGSLPLLAPMSEVAGRLAPQV